MPRFRYDDRDVIVVVGSGAGGGTLAHELCRGGARVVLLEAGPAVAKEEFVDDELRAFVKMSWLDTRTSSGSWSVAASSPQMPSWMGKLVGGTTNLWAGVALRFRDYEFRSLSEYGSTADAHLLDWPLTLEELVPYYERAEQRMRVTHRHGVPPLPANNNYKVFANGALRAGFRDVHTGPMAIDPAVTTQDGFTIQGDRSGAKWSSLVAELPKAEATGKLDLRPRSRAVRITHQADGLADSVLYVDESGALHRQRARAVCLAANAIETPRLLLLSESTLFPDGLANTSGQVGRNYMRHTSGSVFANFERPVRMHRGETMAGVIADEARHDPSRGFNGGYYLELIAGGPIFLATALPGGWGPEFTDAMERYAHTAGMWICGEDMPRETNRITLNHTVSDETGLPVPNLHVDDHPTDTAMREHAYEQGERIYNAVGALNIFRVPPFPPAHNLGTCRMSERPENGVVDRFGRAHDVRNLFVSDGSVFTSSAAANPTLTIVALAIRQADYITDQLTTGELCGSDG